MQVSIDEAEGLTRSLKIAVPAQRVEKEVHTRLADLARTARISGFRPGKIPFKIVEKRYGGQVRQQVVGEVLRSSFQEAVTQEKLTPATGPEIEPLCMEPGKDLEYRAKFEVIPDIKLNDISELDIKLPSASVSDEDVTNAVENIRKSHTQWQEVDRVAVEGDQLMIDYDGKIDGEAFVGGSAEKVPIVLGSKGFLPDFERPLQGASKGQDIDFKVNFPDDYGSDQVAGKTADFAVHIHQVCAPKLPELDAEFIQKLGVENGDLDKFNQAVRSNMEQKIEQSVRETKRRLVMQALFDANPVELPTGLVTQDCERLLREAKSQQEQHQQASDTELTTDQFKEQAKRRVALSLLLGQIITEQKLEADSEKVKNLVFKLAQSAPNPEEVIRYYFSDKNQMAQLESIVLEDQVVDWVIQNAKVTSEQKSFAEITGASTAAS